MGELERMGEETHLENGFRWRDSGRHVITQKEQTTQSETDNAREIEKGEKYVKTGGKERK